MPSLSRERLVRDADPMAQIAYLREQVDGLMRDRVTPMLNNAGDRVGALAQNAARDMQARADGLAGRVRYQPLTALAITAAVAFLLGRATR